MGKKKTEKDKLVEKFYEVRKEWVAIRELPVTIIENQTTTEHLKRTSSISSLKQWISNMEWEIEYAKLEKKRKDFFMSRSGNILKADLMSCLTSAKRELRSLIEDTNKTIKTIITSYIGDKWGVVMTPYELTLGVYNKVTDKFAYETKVLYRNFNEQGTELAPLMFSMKESGIVNSGLLADFFEGFGILVSNENLKKELSDVLWEYVINGDKLKNEIRDTESRLSYPEKYYHID